MLAPLTEPDNRVITDLLLPLCWPRRRGQRWPEHSLNVAISTQECYWTTPRDHRTHPPAALSPSRRLRGSAYHHVLSASGANTALLRGQKPTRARGRHGQTSGDQGVCPGMQKVFWRQKCPGTRGVRDNRRPGTVLAVPGHLASSQDTYAVLGRAVPRRPTVLGLSLIHI